MSKRIKHTLKHYHEEHNDNFIRLYWKSDKEKINEILKALPKSYLKNLLKIWRHYNPGHAEAPHSVIVRYSGYEFYVSWNNITKNIPDYEKDKEYKTLRKNGYDYNEAWKKVYGLIR